MGEERAVTWSEFGLYREGVQNTQAATTRELERLDREIDRVERNGTAALEALRKDMEGRFAAVATQREQDQTTAAATAVHRKEWSWQMKFAVGGLALTLAGLWVQAVAAR